jgi:hypothetical protein
MSTLVDVNNNNFPNENKFSKYQLTMLLLIELEIQMLIDLHHIMMILLQHHRKKLDLLLNVSMI